VVRSLKKLEQTWLRATRGQPNQTQHAWADSSVNQNTAHFFCSWLWLKRCTVAYTHCSTDWASYLVIFGVMVFLLVWVLWICFLAFARCYDSLRLHRKVGLSRSCMSTKYCLFAGCEENPNSENGLPLSWWFDGCTGLILFKYLPNLLKKPYAQFHRNSVSDKDNLAWPQHLARLPF
jgi:hypothetical protein